MTDLELLEMAAKAAGIEIVWGKWLSRYDWLTKTNTGDLRPWNPLIDDGDALRLAVKLRIDVCYENNDGPWHVNAWPRMPHAGCSEIAEGTESTRRAIVRAAAELQRQKENK